MIQKGNKKIKQYLYRNNKQYDNENYIAILVDQYNFYSSNEA